MARYIDADKLLKNSFRIEGHFDLPHGKAQNFSAICDTEIMNFPTADVAPVVHGDWIGKNGVFECSKCGYAFEPEGYLAYFNYCPNCGAKMDG